MEYESSENKYIYGNRDRLFINTCLGCEAKCSYCYLENIEISRGTNRKSAESIIEQFEKAHCFKEGRNGTIISIGCYSECWDELNKEETIKLLNYFIPKGNYIQVATKKRIIYSEIKDIDNKVLFKNQICFYISLPTISNSEYIERGTTVALERIKNFELNKQVKNIEFYLYIKPVLDNITIKDLEKYKDLISKYNLKTIVGTMLSINNYSSVQSDVGDGLLYEKRTGDENKIYTELKQIGTIFKHSTELIESYRQDQSLV